MQPSWQFFFQPPISLQLLHQNECLVPHLKDLFHTCLEPDAQYHFTTLMCVMLAQNTSILHHTKVKVLH